MTTSRLAFDRETDYRRPSPLDVAIAWSLDPPFQRDREALTWLKADDESLFGPRGDPGGDPVRMEQRPGGPVVILAGRPIPAVVQGENLRVGIPDRAGSCVAWALAAGRVPAVLEKR
jgi:hypothetical protein